MASARIGNKQISKHIVQKLALSFGVGSLYLEKQQDLLQFNVKIKFLTLREHVPSHQKHQSHIMLLGKIITVCLKNQMQYAPCGKNGEFSNVEVKHRVTIVFLKD